jgi:TetR/AcrR family transcriptional regulator, repressor of fatR-cypB operon
LEAALDLFEENGFDATAVPEVAKRAGVATGSIYRYFESKDDLVNALYRTWKLRYYEMVLTDPPPKANARAAFSHYWRGMAAFARTYPKAARFLDLHHHRGYLADESLKPERDGQAIAEAFISRGVENGEVRKIAPIVLIALMTGAMRGLLSFADKGELTLDDATVRNIEDCLWNGIKA